MCRICIRQHDAIERKPFSSAAQQQCQNVEQLNWSTSYSALIMHNKLSTAAVYEKPCSQLSFYNFLLLWPLFICTISNKWTNLYSITLFFSSYSRFVIHNGYETYEIEAKTKNSTFGKENQTQSKIWKHQVVYQHWE